MTIQIDNYHISTDSNGYMHICLDCQNIIHDKPKCRTRREAIYYAMQVIEQYNERHDLKWGEAE